MRVKTITSNRKKLIYVVVEEDGSLNLPINRFLKYKEKTNSATNTLKAYAYSLSLYFQFLEEINKKYYEVGIDDIASFIRWLQTPYQKLNVYSLGPVEDLRSDRIRSRNERSINQYLNKVYNFYDYILRHEEYSTDLSIRLKKQVTSNRNGFKSFLHHINGHTPRYQNFIKITEPKKRLKILTEKQVRTLINACTNTRDKFLLLLLYETGIRIGELLSLHLSDIIPATKKLHIKDRGTLENHAELKNARSPRTLDITDNVANLYRTYLVEVHTEEVDTNFIFIKLNGDNKNKPLDYTATQKIFKRLHKKTSIPVTPHMFRHTNLTQLWQTGEMRPETLKERAGHVNIQTTMQMYIHPSEEDIRSDWEKAMQKKKKDD